MKIRYQYKRVRSEPIYPNQIFANGAPVAAFVHGSGFKYDLVPINPEWNPDSNNEEPFLLFDVVIVSANSFKNGVRLATSPREIYGDFYDVIRMDPPPLTQWIDGGYDQYLKKGVVPQRVTI